MDHRLADRLHSGTRDTLWPRPTNNDLTFGDPMTSNRAVRVLSILVGVGVLGASAWYGYGAWTRHQARNELKAAGLTYSEASFIQQACNGNEAATLLFPNAGMSPNTRSIDNSTALECAARTGKVHLITLLMSHGADVNARNNYGHTPLLDAAWSGNAKIVKALLAAGANVNVTDNDGDTPLLSAAYAMCRQNGCDPSVVNLLISHGANPKATNHIGENTLAKMLEGAFGVPEPQLLQGVDILIKSGAAPNATVNGYRPESLLTFVANMGNHRYSRNSSKTGLT